MYLLLCHQVEFFRFHPYNKALFWGNTPLPLLVYAPRMIRLAVRSEDVRVCSLQRCQAAHLHCAVFCLWFFIINYASMFIREIVTSLETKGVLSCQQPCHGLHHSVPVCRFLWSQHSLLWSTMLMSGLHVHSSKVEGMKEDEGNLPLRQIKK